MTSSLGDDHPADRTCAAPAGASVVRVETGAPYDVTIGRGLTEALIAAVGDGGRTERAALIHPEALADRASALASALADARMAVTTVALPDGEAAKDLPQLDRCWSAFAAAGLDRTATVIGYGGGTVTDLAGFAAATWMRGVRLVQAPTTVLGMVDAAVGGKTGINTAAGKNMVGAFYEPAAVVADVDLLATLPRADLTAGMAEVAKCGFIADPVILELIEADPAAATDPARDVLSELIRRGVAVKAAVVGQDLREAGLRENLNYGHTLAHAIERIEDYRWRHGDAVAVGMVFAAELARQAGRIDAALVQRHRRVLRALGLPTAYPGSDLDRLVDVMGRDKKVRHGMLRFVVLGALAEPGRLEGPDREQLAGAFAAIGQS